MQSPKRALLYGFLAWAVWMPTIMGLMMGLPASYLETRVGAAIPSVLLILSVFIFAVLYLRRIRRGSFKEGLYVGLLWMGIFGIFDIVHYLLLAGEVNIPNYLATQFAGYIILPVVTSLLFQLAQAKSSQDFTCC